jgi:hypothetical protein
MVGIYCLKDLGLVKLAVKPTVLGPNILGGLLFGVGWAFLGYCPGTSVGAVAEGRWDALWGIAGMLVGAALFAELFPLLQTSLLTWGNLGNLTLPQVLGLHHWIVIILFVLGSLLLFRFLEKSGL